jgi:orotate phosphoribosyltransferase
MKSPLQLVFERLEAVKHGEFTLSSGKVSDLYVDARKVTLCEDGVYEMLRHFYHLMRKNELKFDTIGGMHTGADPIVGAILADRFAVNTYLSDKHLKAFLWRKEVKEHGTKQLYEGNLSANATILLIDDVATSGGSLLKVAEKVKQLYAGVRIVGAFVVVDREEGAKEALAAQGIPLFACLTRTELCKSEEV